MDKVGKNSDTTKSFLSPDFPLVGISVTMEPGHYNLNDDILKIKDFNILSWWKDSPSRDPII